MIEIKRDKMLIPLKVWDDKEFYRDQSWDQAYLACQLRMAWPHMALMADHHGGYGIPIGAVLPLRDVIVPNFVG